MVLSLRFAPNIRSTPLTRKLLGRVVLRDDDLQSFEIKIKTVKGFVRLSGFVASPGEKFAAGKDAAAIRSVKDVSNDLMVRDPSTFAMQPFLRFSAGDRR